MGIKYSFGQSDFARTQPSSEIQEWSGYPDSPDSLATYPWQFIVINPANKKTWLYCIGSNAENLKFYYYPLYGTIIPSSTWNGEDCYYSSHYLDSGTWIFQDRKPPGTYNSAVFGVDDGVNGVKESNTDIYTDNTYANIWFAKTT